MLKKRVLENPQILGWLGILPFIFTSFFVLFEIRFSLELKVLGLLYALALQQFWRRFGIYNSFEIVLRCCLSCVGSPSIV